MMMNMNKRKENFSFLFFSFFFASMKSAAIERVHNNTPPPLSSSRPLIGSNWTGFAKCYQAE